MSVISPSALSLPPGAPAIPTEPIWRLSVDHYHQMIDSGILTEDDPVELLEGWLVYKMPKKPPHRLATELTRETLEKLIPRGWHINSQEPVTTEESEPEPDLTVVRGERQNYKDRHPGPKDVGLVVEVADATLQRDRGTKKRIYARAAIPIYWIINLAEGQVEVYSDPSGQAEQPDYRRRQDFKRGDQVPVLIDGREIGRLAVQTIIP
jgi:Uma2 family endonuclease